MITPGITNSLFDIPGMSVGHAHDIIVKTGVSVVLPEQAVIAGVDVRGGGPGTRETDTLAHGGLIDRVHAIVLSGGSVYGLAAADAVTAWLGAQGRGYVARPGIPVSPIVPAAILFDNANGGEKGWGAKPPFYDLGVAACDAAGCGNPGEGAIGAGFGATAGLYPGGLGQASEIVDGMTVAAMIAANPVGSPYFPGTDVPYAWPYEVDNEFGGARLPADYQWSEPKDTKLAFLKAAGQSTVIGVVATDAALTPGKAKRLAIMAQDGIAMAVQPAHTPLDGDTIFTLSCGDKPCESPVALAELGAAAARCVARALTIGVMRAGKTPTHI